MGKRLYIILGALLLLRLALAVVTPVFDLSEARYAAISANMDRHDDFLVPRFTYKSRFQSFDGKPPLLFQLSGLACRAFGRSEFAVRLPVLIATVLMLWLLHLTVRKLSNRANADLSVALTATTVSFYALSGFCMTDGLLVPCVTAAFCCYVLFLQTHERNWSLGIFAALALGMLAKGPVALVLFGIPAFLDAWVNRRWPEIRRIRWFWGLLLFAAIAAPWFVLMSKQDPDFLSYFFVNENFLRFLRRDYGDKYGAGHEYFRGMSVIWAAVAMLPWTPLLFLHGRPRLRESAPRVVFLWGVVGIVAFWCLTSRVPLAYLIPIVPLAAAHLALTGPMALQVRILPWAAGVAALVVATGLVVGTLTSSHMQGDKAPYKPKRYSYEFYHGIPPCAMELK